MARKGGLNPEQKGQFGQSWTQAETAPVASGSNSFSFDLKGLKDLETQIDNIIGKFDKLDRKIMAMNGHLGGVSLGSGTGTTGSLTTATVSAINTATGRTAASSATFGGQQQGQQRQGSGSGPPNKITAAGFGGAIAMAAGAELIGNVGGYINQKMGALQTGGVPIQLTAAQQATVTGGATFSNVQAWNGVRNTGQQDLGAAMQMQRQNAFLATIDPRSKNFNNLRGMLNATQNIGGVGAQTAMGLVNALTSNQATNFFQQFSGGRGGPFNPLTGQLRSPQQAFQSTLQVATGSMGLSGTALSNRLKAIATNPERWAATSQNLGMAGLNTQQISLMQEIAAKGGNLTKAQTGPVSKTVAESLLTRTTAGTATANDIMQTTSGLQNAMNAAASAAQGFAQKINGLFPGLTQGGALGAFALKSATSVGANYLMIRGILKAMGVKVAGSVAGEAGAGGAAAAAGTTTAGVGGAEGGAAVAGGIAAGPAVAAGAAAAALGLSVYAVTQLKASKRKIHGQTMPPPGSIPDNRGGFLYHGHDFKSADQFYNSLGDPVGTGGMQPNLAHGITAMKAANPSIQINSGYRTQGQQAALYAAKGGVGVARPGQSPHQLGKAADIGPPSQFAWIAANAPRFGLASDRNEPWHIQAMGDSNAGSTVTGAQVVAKASSQLGTPYGWGGETPGKAFDCSGLVQWVFAQVGISLPRTSQAQANVGKPVNGLNNAQAGDIICYSEPGEGPNSHVAIYIGGGKQIAAPHTGTVVQVQPVDTSHISTIRRVIGGGAGGAVVAAAQGAVGQSSNDSSNHSGGTAAVSAGTSLANTFISQVASSWLGGGGVGVGGAGSGPTGGGSSGSAGSTTTASTGSTAIVGGAGGNISSPTGFSKAVLSQLGLAATLADVTNLNAWQQQEGQWGASGIYNAMQMHDPLNTNLPEKGGHSLNGTWFYPDWATGVAATVSTIKQGNMSAIYKALQANDTLSAFSSAAESTPWAASAYGGRSWPAPSGVYAVGDPTGGFQPNLPGPSYGGGGPVSSMRSGGGRGVNVTLGPIYVQGTQADANNIASMVAAAIKGNRDIQSVAGS